LKDLELVAARAFLEVALAADLGPRSFTTISPFEPFSRSFLIRLAMPQTISSLRALCIATATSILAPAAGVYGGCDCNQQEHGKQCQDRAPHG